MMIELSKNCIENLAVIDTRTSSQAWIVILSCRDILFYYFPQGYRSYQQSACVCVATFTPDALCLTRYFVRGRFNGFDIFFTPFCRRANHDLPSRRSDNRPAGHASHRAVPERFAPQKRVQYAMRSGEPGPESDHNILCHAPVGSRNA